MHPHLLEWLETDYITPNDRALAVRLLLPDQREVVKAVVKRRGVGSSFPGVVVGEELT